MYNYTFLYRPQATGYRLDLHVAILVLVHTCRSTGMRIIKAHYPLTTTTTTTYPDGPPKSVYLYYEYHHAPSTWSLSAAAWTLPHISHAAGSPLPLSARGAPTSN